MSTVGILLLFVGTFALVGFFFLRYKSGRMGNTPFVPTGDAASRGDTMADPKKALSVQGKVHCPTPLESPVTRTPSLYYELQVTAKWKNGDNSMSVNIRDEKSAAPFTLDDGSGPVSVDASKGGDFELKETFSKTQSRGLISTFKDSALAFGNHGFNIMPGGKVKGVTIPETADYEVVEKCLLVPERLYAIGKHEQGRLISPDWASLFLTARSRDEALAETLKKLKLSRNLAIGGLATGALFSVLGMIFAPEQPTVIEPASTEVSNSEAAATVPGEAAPAEAAPADGTAPTAPAEAVAGTTTP